MLFQQQFVGKSSTFVIPGLVDSFPCLQLGFCFTSSRFTKTKFYFLFIVSSTQCVLQKLISPTHERRTHKKIEIRFLDVGRKKFANYLKSCAERDVEIDTVLVVAALVRRNS